MHRSRARLGRLLACCLAVAAGSVGYHVGRFGGGPLVTTVVADTVGQPPVLDSAVIRSESQAIAWAAPMLPAGAAVTAATARLVERSSAFAWFGASSADEAPGGKVWLVGIRSPGLSEGDAARFFIGDMDFPTRHEPIDGLLVMLDAQGGAIMGVASLRADRRLNYNSILSMPAEESEP